jgi:hypothetical protein
VNATMDGVVRMPSAFSMTFGWLPSITATQELVVPRSMPITFDMVQNLMLLTWLRDDELLAASDPVIHLVTPVPRRDVYLEFLMI